MKNILVPTDFSTCAGYAVDAAMQLAKKTGAMVHLYHSLGLIEYAQQEQLAREKANIRLTALKNQYANINIDLVVNTGIFIEELGHYTSTHATDLIVMGSQGASGGPIFYLGSNTQKAIRRVHCPVLVVKKPLSKLDFSKVAFASTFNWDDRPAFERFKEIVKYFIPEIHLVAIQTTGFFEAPAIVTLEAMEEFKKLAAPFTCHIHLKREGTVDQGILEFAKSESIQLIGVSNVHRHPVKRVFTGSNVEAIVNQAEVPVLSIDYLNAE